MKVKTKILSTFLKKVRMTGTQQITQAILRFGEDGLKVNANGEAKQSRVMGLLGKKAFDEYEVLGNVGMNDLSNVIKVLERFGEVITLKKTGNVLTIKGDSKTVDIELVDENFILEDTGEPNLEFTDIFDITWAKLNDIIKDVQMNKDAVMTIKTAPKVVAFTNTGKYKFTTTVEAPTCKGTVSVNFGQPFIDVVAELEGTLQVSVKTDYPCKIIEKLENSFINIIVAPRMANEEQ